MRKDIHPKMRDVVFKDISCDFAFLGTSTLDSKETIAWENGKTYPLIKVEISRPPIHFTLENRELWILKAELTDSKRNTVRNS